MRLTALLTAALPFMAVAAAPASDTVNQTTCGGKTYTYTGLAGYGFVPSNATDKYGDTLGGYGSSAAIDQSSWRKRGNGSYTGIVYTLPDRGWNTNGTLNFQNRIHKLSIVLTLATKASAENPSQPNLQLNYLDTILLTGPDGQPTTSLDADSTGFATYPGFPPLPVATYEGDGFGGEGPGGKRIAVDGEGLALGSNGTFWVSDEYGPYVYHFDKNGKMLQAIQPPQAFLPRRNGTLSFSSGSAPIYNPEASPVPENTDMGRDNNQGFEALTISRDGRTLYTMIQSALNQEGGPESQNRQPARLLEYDISGRGAPVYKHEYVVMLPKYRDYTKDANDKEAYRVASQSEMLELPTGDFLVLARDSHFGKGQDNTRSVYRHADVISIRNTTTDLKGKRYDAPKAAIASPDGVLKEGIMPAEYCSFLDYNVDSELAKFNLRNGDDGNDADQDGDEGRLPAILVNEKWESLTLVPVEPSSSRRDSHHGEYFLFSFSDNDFMTQDGHMNFGKFDYADGSGNNLDNQVLVFKLSF